VTSDGRDDIKKIRLGDEPVEFRRRSSNCAALLAASPLIAPILSTLLLCLAVIGSVGIKELRRRCVPHAVSTISGYI
jgi:hypothetical protein